ncbi:unnamed protein product (macronuclear) [Paramecium tetraurelia]|uniref:60S ribosomal protein L37 n=1 Tax=Paramecium tetraurelia TaxID=5888 RepID=A0CIJ3_PARTE|nr:uncharacterized protein GSPATT00007745001 [Paramecium tetraurelia]CAK70610.1 unnamed protein product [Paramecium tetraurelia]|eukprot:XP_001438007.1 hypothetical protein (macronuclear) [Paramecium tetraurelia strain d4-2]
MVNVPKNRKTYCRKCGSHQSCKVSQYKKSKESPFAQGRRRYDMKQIWVWWINKANFQKESKDNKKSGFKA